jgi:hypothetical protein
MKVDEGSQRQIKTKNGGQVTGQGYQSQWIKKRAKRSINKGRESSNCKD